MNQIKKLFKDYSIPILNSVLSRLLTIFAFVYLGYITSGLEYGLLVSSYNITMIILSIVITPILSLFIKEKVKELECFYIFLCLFICLISVLIDIWQKEINNSRIYSFSLFTIFFAVTQLNMVYSTKSNNELYGAFSSFILNIVMWSLLYFVIKNENIQKHLVYVFLINILTIFAYYRNEIIKLIFGLRQYKNYLKQSFIPLLNSSLVTGIGFLMFFMLINKNVMNDGGENLQILNIGYQWFQIVVFFATSISTKFIYNIVNKKINKNDIFQMLVFLFIVYFLSIIVFYYFNNVYRIVDKEKLLEAGLIFISASLFSAISSLLGCIFVAKNTEKIGFYFNSAWLSYLFLAYFLLNYFTDLSQLHIATLAFLISYFIHMISLIVYFSKGLYEYSSH